MRKISVTKLNYRVWLTWPYSAKLSEFTSWTSSLIVFAATLDRRAWWRLACTVEPFSRERLNGNKSVGNMHPERVTFEGRAGIDVLLGCISLRLSRKLFRKVPLTKVCVVRTFCCRDNSTTLIFMLSDDRRFVVASQTFPTITTRIVDPTVVTRAMKSSMESQKPSETSGWLLEQSGPPP